MATLFSYICDECGFTDEYFHDRDERPEFKCENCNTIMRKELGLNFKLKGGGYYSTGVGASEAKVIKQTVMGVKEGDLDKVDNRIKDKAMKAKVKEPNV